MAFSGFGSTSTAQPFGGSAFGSAQPKTGFGNTTSLFGQASTSAPTFGTSTSVPSFGASGGFGASGFGAPAANSFGTSGTFSFTNTPNSNLIRPTATFASTAPALGGFGQPQPQQSLFQPNQVQQQPQQNQMPFQNSEVANLCSAVTACNVFGDDRDAVIAKLNLVQASWGVGRAFFSSSAPPIILTPHNPLCRFKAVGYSVLPKASKESDSQLSCVLRKKASEVEQNKNQISADLSLALGNRPNIRVNIDAVNGYDSSDFTELIFSVSELNLANNSIIRKVSSHEVLSALNQPNIVQGLQQKHSIENLSQKCSYTEDQLREYLDNPPQGIDPKLWRQAQLDNPDPKSFLPVPMIGFKALQARIKCQETLAKCQQGRLDSIASDISRLQKAQQESWAKQVDSKRKQVDFFSRVLRIISWIEGERKRGYTIQPEDENLRVQLEALQAEMSAPTQFRGRLNELLSQVRLHSQISSNGGSSKKFTIDPIAISEIHSLLKQQQQGIQAVLKSIKSDISHLDIIDTQNKSV